MHVRQDEVQLHEEVRVQRARCVEARSGVGPRRAHTWWTQWIFASSYTALCEYFEFTVARVTDKALLINIPFTTAVTIFSPPTHNCAGAATSTYTHHPTQPSTHARSPFRPIHNRRVPRRAVDERHKRLPLDAHVAEERPLAHLLTEVRLQPAGVPLGAGRAVA